MSPADPVVDVVVQGSPSIDVIVQGTPTIDVFTGIPGPPGDDGIAGPAGPQGPPGPQGPQGSSADLPTAATGQVLVSQGPGVPPVFSSYPTVSFLDVLYAFRVTQGGIFTWGVLSTYEVAFANAGSVYVGGLQNISDSTTDVPGAVIAGGGTKHVLARWNGTAWTVVAGPDVPRSIELYDPSGDPGIRRWRITVVGADIQIHSTNDAGVSYGRPVAISAYNGSITTSPGGGINATDSALYGKYLVLAEATLSAMNPGSVLGTLAGINDSTTDVPGSTVVGGGTKHVLARWNGTIWKVIG